MDDPEPLQMLNGMVGEFLTVGGCDFTHWLPAHPREVPADARERVFQTARGAATDLLLRNLLRRSGLVPADVPRSSEGFRRWPAGWVGSVSNKRTVIIALLGSASGYRGLGVDLEYDDGSDLTVVPGLTAPGEVPPSFARRSTEWHVVLSAKEAVYKALFPTLRLPLGYDDIVLSWPGPAGQRAVAQVGSASVEIIIGEQAPWIVSVAIWR